MAGNNMELMSDQELIELTREGQQDAFAILWKRHYAVALSLARSLWRGEAEDLVSEAFTNVLRAIKNGSGPTTAFRAYLCMVIRNLDTREHAAADQVRTGLEEYSAADSPVEGAMISDDDNERIRRVFYAMKPQSRKLLWMSAVEELKPRQIAEELGLKPNHVTTLTHRARGEFVSLWAQSYVDMNKGEHHDFLEHVGEYVAGKASPYVTEQVEQHLAECEECRRVVAEVTDVFSAFRSRIAPAVAGVPALVLMASPDQQAYGATITTPPTAPRELGGKSGGGRSGGGKGGGGRSFMSKMMLMGIALVAFLAFAGLAVAQAPLIGDMEPAALGTPTPTPTPTFSPAPTPEPAEPAATPPAPPAPPAPEVVPAEPRRAPASQPASRPEPVEPAAVPAIVITKTNSGPQNVCFPVIFGTAKAGSVLNVSGESVVVGSDGNWNTGPLTGFRAGSQAVGASAVDGKQTAASAIATMANSPGLTISRTENEIAVGVHSLAGIPVDLFVDGKLVGTLTADGSGRAQGTYGVGVGEHTVTARYHPVGCEGAVSTLSIG